MSKKKKKFNREEIQKRLLELEKESTGEKPAYEVPQKDTKNKPSEQAPPEVISSTKEQTAGDFVLRDLTRLFITLSIVALIFVALIILNSKTNLFFSFGDRIFNFLNIS